MKHLILLLALIAFALPIVNAVPDSFITGPYNVSFDLGLKNDEYTVNVLDPEITETMGGDKRTEYSVIIRGPTGTYQGASITIKDMEEEELPTTTTGSIWELALKEDDDPRISGFRSDTRAIDGASGAIASMTMRYDSETIVDLYHAIYQAPFDPTHTVVEIFSFGYPWDEGTLQLLKTIHVDKNFINFLI